MPTKIYLVPLKLNADRLERIRYIMELNKDDYCLIASCVIADYIVTGLKSPSRIVRNIRGATCPVVHVNWLLESFQLRKFLKPEPYFIDVSAARSLLLALPPKPLPKQVTWDHLAEIRQARDNINCTGLYERRMYYRHNGRLNKTKQNSKHRALSTRYTQENALARIETRAETKIETNMQMSIQQEDLYNDRQMIDSAIATVNREPSTIKESSKAGSLLTVDDALPGKQEASHAPSSLTHSCSSSSLDFDQPPCLFEILSL